MDEPTTKAKILELIYTEWEALQAVLDQLTEAQMTQPGVENDWTVKDILAHITDWEQRMVGWIDESLDGDGPDLSSDWSDEILNALNQEIYESNKDRTLEDVLEEFQLSYRQSWKAVERLTDEDLFEPDRFRWREGRPMWSIVEANMSGHYKEHNEMIEKWIEQHRQG